MSKQEKKQGWTKLEKGLGIIAIIIVGFYIILLVDHYTGISMDFRDMPISMTESSLNKQCHDLREEYTNLKEFLGVGDLLTTEQIESMSWEDFQEYVRLDMKIRELNCSLEPDT